MAEHHLPAHPPLGDPGMTLHVADRAAVLAVTSSRRAGSPSVQMPHFADAFLSCRATCAGQASGCRLAGG